MPCSTNTSDMEKLVRVAILGCGPAGLFAAQAVASHKKTTELVIFSNRRKSELYGAQYLHEPIPGLPANPTKIQHILHGRPEDYRSKVYGPLADFPVSPMYLEGWGQVWDIRSAYSAAWTNFGDHVVNMLITPNRLQDLLSGRRAFGFHDFDLIISSIPRFEMCMSPNSHQFTNRKVWAVGEAPDRGIRFPREETDHIPLVPEGTMIYSGMDFDRWYRASRIFGHGTIEWPIDRRPASMNGLTPVRVTKPLSTNCNCFSVGPVRIEHVGRYGTWTKGVLSHHAYHRAAELMESM